MVRPPLPAPSVVLIVPSLTSVEPIDSVEAFPQPELVRTRFPVELMRSLSPAIAVFFVASVTLSEQVPWMFSVSWSPLVPEPRTSESTVSVPTEGWYVTV